MEAKNWFMKVLKKDCFTMIIIILKNTIAQSMSRIELIFPGLLLITFLANWRCQLKRGSI
jgi:hypothetical protein